MIDNRPLAIAKATKPTLTECGISTNPINAIVASVGNRHKYAVVSVAMIRVRVYALFVYT